MFRTSQEFTFSVKQGKELYDFTGQLVFSSKDLNNIGMLHTQEEIDSFGTLLNTLTVPEYWTLETLAQHLFINARPVFQNLRSINLFLTKSPQTVSEYSEDIEVDGELLSMEAIG